MWYYSDRQNVKLKGVLCEKFQNFLSNVSYVQHVCGTVS